MLRFKACDYKRLPVFFRKRDIHIAARYHADVTRAYESVDILLILADPLKCRDGRLQCSHKLYVAYTFFLRRFHHHRIRRRSRLESYCRDHICDMRVLCRFFQRFERRIHYVYIYVSVSFGFRKAASASRYFHHITECEQDVVLLRSIFYAFVYICRRRYAHRAPRAGYQLDLVRDEAPDTAFEYRCSMRAADLHQLHRPAVIRLQVIYYLFYIHDTTEVPPVL